MENYHQNRPTSTTNPPLGFGGFLNQTKVVGNNRRALREIGNAVDIEHSFAIKNKNVLENKRSLGAIGAHRPITRSFAATLKSQSASQGLTHKPILAPSCPWHDQLLPMVEEKGEVDPCEPKEIEMEEITVDEIMPDIDSVDRNNSLAVVNYVEDIYSYYRKMEEHSCVSPDYMSNQFDVNDKMRAILIDWLIEVHYKFELMEETLYLTVSIIDRFLAQQSVVRKKLQLVGVTAMLLACKYEEVSVPVVEDLVLISDRAYTRKEVLDMEKLIINTLRFNLSLPTPYVFMRRFLKAANSDKELELLSYFIIELSLVEFTVLKFRPSMLAAAAIYTALSALRGRNQWNKIIGFHTCYTEQQLLECSKMMVEFHHNAGAGKLTATFRKYNSFRFGFASKIKPALFLLDAKPFSDIYAHLTCNRS